MHYLIFAFSSWFAYTITEINAPLNVLSESQCAHTYIQYIHTSHAEVDWKVIEWSESERVNVIRIKTLFSDMELLYRGFERTNHVLDTVENNVLHLQQLKGEV